MFTFYPSRGLEGVIKPFEGETGLKGGGLRLACFNVTVKMLGLELPKSALKEAALVVIQLSTSGLVGRKTTKFTNLCYTIKLQAYT